MTERQIVNLAALFELRLIFKNDGKESYTIEEIFEILDKFADTDDQ